ncbi:MAG: hypothetical protein E6G91_13375 [Alphaproteobacteria bacterium]|nr:MAG: hypothetical protein E6G91_13375 [Alphaproteobacteria bacterium]
MEEVASSAPSGYAVLARLRLAAADREAGKTAQAAAAFEAIAKESGANGDLASVLLFGSFLGFAVYDRISVIGRLSPGPLGNVKGGALHDIVVIAVGLALYALLLFWGHAKLTGVALLPG